MAAYGGQAADGLRAVRLGKRISVLVQGVEGLWGLWTKVGWGMW
jgi:hypothetical protein